MREHKFHAVATTVDGHKFPSKKEARRYGDLKLLERAGKISQLTLQPSYTFTHNGVEICKYVADFQYWDCEKNIPVTEDSKGVRTPAYVIKRKLLKAFYGIEVLET